MRALPHPVVVIDDWQYILANEFMRRSDEKGYEKFTEIGRHAWDILSAAADLAPDRRVYILAHTANDERVSNSTTNGSMSRACMCCVKIEATTNADS